MRSVTRSTLAYMLSLEEDHRAEGNVLKRSRDSIHCIHYGRNIEMFSYTRATAVCLDQGAPCWMHGCLYLTNGRWTSTC